MSVQKFQVGSTNTILAQPDVEYVYTRSDSASDTGTLTVAGEQEGGGGASESIALTGKREILFGTSWASMTAGLLSAAQVGVVSVYTLGVPASGFIIISTQPANNDTLLIGLTGFQQTYTFKTSLTGAANEIKIGADVSATADNLKRAINDSGTEGTHYGTGTAANAYVSATASASLITITDHVSCRRQLGWAISQGVGATIGIAAPSGGVDGTLLATLAAGVTASYNAFSLDSEDLVATTLPALLAPTTDALFVGGKVCTLRFKCASVSNPIELDYQTSTDGESWAGGLSAITDLDALSVAAPQFVHPSESNIEYIRLVFGSNGNAADTPLDACVIY